MEPQPRRNADERRVTIASTREFALGVEDSDEDMVAKKQDEENPGDGDDGEDITPSGHHHRHHKGRLKLWRRRLFAMGWIYVLYAYRRLPTTILLIFMPAIVLTVFVVSITFHFHWELSGRAKIELTKDAQESVYTMGSNTVILRKYFTENEFICHKHGGTIPGESYIIFTPNNTFTQDFMKRVLDLLQITNSGYGVNSETELIAHCRGLYRDRQKNSGQPTPIGLIFKHYDVSSDKNGSDTLEGYLSRPFSYTIRTYLPEVANTKELFPYYKALKKEQNLSPYVGSGFLGLQNAIDFAYMDLIADDQARRGHPDARKTRDRVAQTLRQSKYYMFPFPVYLDIKARTSTWFLLVLALILGNFFQAFTQSKKIIEDKESGRLELLRLHGLSTSVYWVSVLLQDILSRSIQAGLVTIILVSSLTNVAFFEYTNPGLLWFVFYLYGFAQASFLYTCSLIFSGANFGAMASCIVGILTFIAPMTLYVAGFNLGKTFNFILCLFFPNWCLANALYDFLKFESYDTGVQLSIVARFVDERRIIISESLCIFLFILSTICYFLLVCYIDNVQKKLFIPSERRCYWLRRRNKIEDEGDDVIEAEFDDEDFAKPIVYESFGNGKVSMKCRRVSQIFNGFLQALDNVNMNVYEGEVTLLLGNNGSGKSTLIRILAGIMKPSGGYALLYGRPIFGNIDIVQDHIGFCPKPYLFYKYLTVEEHIQLCCLLHGNEFTITKRQCNALLIRFNLYKIRKSSTRSLTEAEKRKLSLAMALANNPKILILDNPTSGMDSSGVHEIWTLLRGMRNKRAIISTANTIEEGHLYAERIGIMANGRLLSFSSSTFLRTALNAGSYVRLEKTENKEVDIPGVIKTIQHVIGTTAVPVAQVHMKAFEHFHAQAYFSIPPSAQLSKVLRALEDKNEQLGFTKVGIMHMTLPSVLYDLTHRAGINQDNIGAFISTNPSNPYENVRLPVEVPTISKDFPKIPTLLSTITALFMKQISSIRQEHRFYWMEYLFPLLMTFLLVYFAEFYIWSQPEDKALLLSVNTYSMSNLPVYLDDILGPEAQTFKKGLLSIIRNRADHLVIFGGGQADKAKFQQTLKHSEVSGLDYRAQTVSALSTDKDTAYYASNALHSAPASHNLLTNLLLFSFTDDSRKDTNPYRINAYNHPFIEYEEQASGTSSDVTNAAVGCIISLLLSLIAASKILFPLTERLTGCKTVQFVAGVTPVQYWVVMALCDAMFNFTIAILFMGTIYVSDFLSKNAFQGFETKRTLFTITCAYLCCSSLPYGYILCKYMTRRFSGYGQYVIIHIMFGILPQLLTYILLHDSPFGVRATMEILFSFLPPYTMAGALVRFINVAVERNYCMRIPIETEELCLIYDQLIPSKVILDMIRTDPYFKLCCRRYCERAGTCYELPPFLERTLEIPMNMATCIYMMLFQGLFYFVILFVLEYELIQKFWRFIQLNFVGDVEAARIHLIREIEADTTTELSVKKEVERIEAIAEAGDNTEEPDIFYTRNISKWTGKKELVSHIYFGIPPASVLGIMGSGKTTLARILVGDLLTNIGYCQVEPRLRVDKNKHEYLKKISYCPFTKGDAILPFLTGFQMMQLIGRLRGLPVNYLDIHCRKWLELFRFSVRDMTTVCSKYDRGMKRRLCCAMALLGNCEVIIFDEPTTSQDVISHQNFWSIIQLVRLNGQSIIFTSISAQECIENSTKMILLEEGKMKAIGSPSVINEQYATGWTVVITFRNDLTTKFSRKEIETRETLVKEYIEEMYSPCELKESIGNLLIYHVKEKVKPLSEMYSIMETIHSDMAEFIRDYLIEESSLDDIMGYFGGSQNRRMKLPSFSSSDEDSPATSNFGDTELSDENRLKWDGLKNRFLSVSPVDNISGSGSSNFDSHVPNIVRKSMLVRVPLNKAKIRNDEAARHIAGAQPHRKSFFNQKISRNENIFNFLQKRTAEVEKRKASLHPRSPRSSEN